MGTELNFMTSSESTTTWFELVPKACITFGTSIYQRSSSSSCGDRGCACKRSPFNTISNGLQRGYVFDVASTRTSLLQLLNIQRRACALAHVRFIPVGVQSVEHNNGVLTVMLSHRKTFYAMSCNEGQVTTKEV